MLLGNMSLTRWIVLILIIYCSVLDVRSVCRYYSIKIVPSMKSTPSNFSGNWATFVTEYEEEGYALHSRVHLRELRSESHYKDGKTFICAGFNKIVTTTRELTSGSALVRVEASFTSNFLAALVTVDTSCWERKRDMSACEPKLIIGPKVLATPVLAYTPIRQEFWDGFQDSRRWNEMYEVENLSIQMFGNTNFSSEWMSKLNTSIIRSLEVTGNDWGLVRSLLLEYLPTMQMLNLSGNNIQVLPENTLMDNSQLKYVHLNHNNISKLPAGLKYLRRIEELDLSYQITNNTLTISDSDIYLLSKVKHLYIQRTHLNVNFSKLLESEFLSELNLSGCMLPEPSGEQPTVNRSHLGVLDLSFNNLTTLPIPGLPELRELYLQGNLFETCPTESRRNKTGTILNTCFYGLPKLSLIDMSWNKIASLESSWFKGLKHLSEINLSHNKISVTESNIFTLPEQLKILDISYNELSESPVLCSVITYSIDLSHNHLKTVPELTNKTKFLVDLDMTSDFTSIQLVFSGCILLLHQLNLSHYNLFGIYNELALSYTRILPQGLTSNLDQPSRIVGQRNNTIVDVSHNTMGPMNLIELAMKEVKYLDLSWNYITSVEKMAFYEFKNLQYVNLSQNRIYIINEESFLYLPHLKVLHVSYNNLREFSPVINSNLSLLDLSHNSITRVSVQARIDFLDLSQNLVVYLAVNDARRLNLSYNSVRDIPKSFWDSFKKLDTLDLGGNEFTCCKSYSQYLYRIISELRHAVRNLNTTEDFMCKLIDQEPKISLFETWYNRSICRSYGDANRFSKYMICIWSLLGISGILMIVFLIAATYYRRKQLARNRLYDVYDYNFKRDKKW